MDEVGPLEIRGEGWAPCLPPLLALDGPVHLWVVRHTCLEKVRHAWKLENVAIVDVKEPGAAWLLKSFCMSTGRGAGNPAPRIPEKAEVELV